VLPSTGVIESSREGDGEVVGRTSVTCRRRERPCLVAAFPCRTGRCCFVVVTLPLDVVDRVPVRDATSLTPSVEPPPRPCFPDLVSWTVVAVGIKSWSSQSKCPSPGSRTFIFFPLQFFLSFEQFCCLT